MEHVGNLNTAFSTLLVAFHSYAGMGPYVVSIINSFDPKDNIYFYLIEGEDKYYTKNIKRELLSKSIIKEVNRQNKLRTIYNLILDGRTPFHNEILSFCKDQKIDIIHDLTGTTDISIARTFNKDFKLIYTVHDVIPHEIKKSFFKHWRLNILYNRISKAIHLSDNLLTNSIHQYSIIEHKFPLKRCFYTPFPTLINNSIIHGHIFPQEINNVKDYILFFGRIEKYKGVELLIEAFKMANLPTNVNLVIAGKGDIYTNLEDERIIWINRYVDDTEIASLYHNAKVVVYPYISSTQSGVLSIASFFGTPIIASNVPFFKEVLTAKYPLLFETESIKNLKSKLELFFRLDKNETLAIKDRLKEIYLSKYSNEAIRDNLLSIYEEVHKI
ncbi:MAG: glycosyltransferase family 4 protein [Muribaculaceae bacterium]|nr:glycosyltransferase family 4 protein [Muribaculaceae bacterium]